MKMIPDKAPSSSFFLSIKNDKEKHVEKIEITSKTSITVKENTEYYLVKESAAIDKDCIFIVTVKNNHLYIHFSNDLFLILKNFFGTEKNSSIHFPSTFSYSDYEYHVYSTNIPLGEPYQNDETLIYAYGLKESLFQTFGHSDVWDNFNEQMDFSNNFCSFVPSTKNLEASSSDYSSLSTHSESTEMPSDKSLSLLGAGGLVSLVTTFANMPAALLSKIVSGTIVLGPTIQEHGLTLNIYDKSGELLISDVTIDPSGNYRVKLPSDYEGSLLLEVTGTSTDPDYMDEATGQAKNLSSPIRSMIYVNNESESKTVNITPLTELAVLSLGIESSDKDFVDKIKDISENNPQEAIFSANKQIATALGLENTDILSSPIIPLIDKEGIINNETNDYGKVLAAISALEESSKSPLNETLSRISTGLQGETLNKRIYDEINTVSESTFQISIKQPKSFTDSIDISEHITTDEAIYTLSPPSTNFIGKYLLEGDDANSFNINEDGSLVFLSQPNYQQKQLYYVDLVSLDSKGEKHSTLLKININQLEAVDLNASEENSQRFLSKNVNKVLISQGVPLCSDLQAPSEGDIKSISFTFKKDSFDLNNDILILEKDLLMNSDQSEVGITLGSVPNINYTYSSTEASLNIAKEDSSFFTGDEIKSIIESIHLKNDSSSLQDGKRETSIRYIGENDYKGLPSEVIIDVHGSAPTVVNVSDSTDLEFAYEAVTFNVTFSHSIESLLADDIILIDSNQNALDLSLWSIEAPVSEDGQTWEIQITPPEAPNDVENISVGIQIEAGKVLDSYGNSNDAYIQTDFLQKFDTKNPLLFSGGDSAQVSIVENTNITEPLYTPKVYGKNIAEDSEGFTYELSGPDADAFNITPKTGELSLKASPDYETKTSYELEIKAIYDGIFDRTQALEITVLNQDDTGPSMPPIGTLQVNENIPTDNFIYDFQAIDNYGAADADISYSLDESTNSILRIDPENGQLFLTLSPNYENQKEYDFRVNIKDNEGVEESFLGKLEILNEKETTSFSTHISAEDDPSMKNGVKDNSLLIQFEDAFSVQDFTLDQILFVDTQKTFGQDANLEAINVNNNYAHDFRIILGTDTNISNGDAFVIKKENLKIDTGETLDSNIELAVPDIVPPTLQILNFFDADQNQLYSENDQIIFHFSEGINENLLSLDSFVLDTNSWGEGATIKSTDKKGLDNNTNFSKEFILQLGSSVSVNESNIISLDGSHIEDSNQNKSIDNLTHQLATLNLPRSSAFESIQALDLDQDEMKDDGFLIQFSQPIESSNLDISDLNLNNGHDLGSSATIEAKDSSSGFSKSFTISYGTDASVIEGDLLSIKKDAVKNETGLNAEKDILFLVPDTKVLEKSYITSAKTQGVRAPVIEGFAKGDSNITLTFTLNSQSYSYQTTSSVDGSWSITLGIDDQSNSPTFNDKDFFDFYIDVKDSNGNLLKQMSNNLSIDLTSPVYKDYLFNPEKREISLNFDDNLLLPSDQDIYSKIILENGDGSNIAASEIESIFINPNALNQLNIQLKESVDLTKDLKVSIQKGAVKNLASLDVEEVDIIDIITTNPVILEASLRINQGETLLITKQFINVVDANSSDENLIIEVDQVTGGSFQLDQKDVSSFTQQNVLDGRVSFQHDGQSDAPSFMIGVSDEYTSIPPELSGNIRFGKVSPRNLISHWDARNIDGDGDISTNPSDGESLSLWKDVSGSANNHDAFQNTLSMQPTYAESGINGHPAVLFGADTRFDVLNHRDINASSSASEKSLAVVLKTGADIQGPQIIYEQGGGIRGYSFVLDQGHIYAGVWNAGEWDRGHSFKSVDLGVVEAETVYTIGIVQDSTSGADETNTLDIYLNGLRVAGSDHVDPQSSHQGEIGMGGLKLNTVNPSDDQELREDSAGLCSFDGYIGDLLLWNYALTPDEMKSMANYTFNKWDISVNPACDINGLNEEGFDFQTSGASKNLISLVSPSAYLGDPDSSRYRYLAIEMSNILDLGSEFLSYDNIYIPIEDHRNEHFFLNTGVEVAASVKSEEENLTLTFTNVRGGTLTQEDLDNLFTNLHYKNMKDTASFGTRTFNFLIEDIDGNISNEASTDLLLSGYIYGSDGDDTSEGSAGNDTFIGSQGNDTLTGNGGQDTFALASVLDGNDTITDFTLDSNTNNDADKIDLSEVLTVQNANDLSSFCEILDNGNNQDVIINIDTDGNSNFITPEISLTLENIGTNSLTLSDFISQDVFII